MGAVFNLVLGILKLLAPVVLFLIGRRNQRKDDTIKALKKEASNERESVKVLEDVRHLSDSELIDRVYERPDPK